MNAAVHHAILMVFVLTSLDLSSVLVTKDTLEMELFVLVQEITSYNVILLAMQFREDSCWFNCFAELMYDLLKLPNLKK